ncbi:Hypothetical predicted protein [Argonauta hians]
MNLLKHGNLKKHKTLLSKLKKEYTKSRRFCGFIRLDSTELDRTEWEEGTLVDIIEDSETSCENQKYFSPSTLQNLDHSISPTNLEPLLASESVVGCSPDECEYSDIDKFNDSTSFEQNEEKIDESSSNVCEEENSSPSICEMTIVTDVNHNDSNMSRLSDMSSDYYQVKKRITRLYTEMDLMFKKTKLEFRNLYRKLHKSLYRSPSPNHMDGMFKTLDITDADVDRYFQLCRDMDKISKRIFINYKLMVKMSKVTLDYEKVEHKVISKYVKNKALLAFRKRTENDC